MIDKFIGILKKELQNLNTSQSYFYNHNWWAEEDMEEFLVHLKEKCVIEVQDE